MQVIDLNFFLGLGGAFLAGIATFYLWYRYNRQNILTLLNELLDLYSALKVAAKTPSADALIKLETEFYEFLVALSKLLPIRLPQDDTE